MKMKLTAVLSVILCVTGTFAASNADYVQDGLVTHFDAIDNAGTGAHVSNAAQWRDLKGSASIALVSGASWSDMYLNSGTTRHSIANMPAYDRDSMTLEAVVNVISNGPPSGNYWPRIFADGEWCGLHPLRHGTSARKRGMDAQRLRRVAPRALLRAALLQPQARQGRAAAERRHRQDSLLEHVPRRLPRQRRRAPEAHAGGEADGLRAGS